MKRYIAGLIAPLFLQAPAIAGSFSKIDSPTDSYTGSVNSYEIYGVSYQTVGDRIRVTLDTNVPLAGHQEGGASDNHVGHTDLRISTPNGDFGIKFTNNENNNPIGLYKNVNTSSIVTTNFGRSSNYPHSLVSGGELLTTDIQVYEFAGSGLHGSNRIVVELPARYLDDGISKVLHATFECGNDHIELEIPKAVMDLVPPAVDEPITPVMTEDTPELTIKRKRGLRVAYVMIPALILILVLLLGGNNDSSDMDSDGPGSDEPGCKYNCGSDENPPTEEPPSKKVNEPDFSHITFLLLMLLAGTFAVTTSDK